MTRKPWIVSFIIIFSVVIFAISLTSSFAGDRITAPVPGVHKIGQMTKEQFKALPDNAVIEINGRQVTKQHYLAEIEQKHMQASHAKMQAMGAQMKADFEKRRVQFLKDQRAKLDASNAHVQAQFASLRQQSADPARASKHKAIQQEARQLYIKSKTASPADRDQIEKRAGELLQQLKQMGY